MLSHAEKSNQEDNQSTKIDETSGENIADILIESTHSNQRTRQLKKIQKNTNNSSRVNAITQLQSMADNYVKKTENRTELLNNIKSGVENLSGALLDEFKVDGNLDKPTQLSAHTFTQENEINIAPGKENSLKLLDRHAVNQKQDQVSPPIQMKGKVNINDDIELEREADIMGAKALNNSGTVDTKTHRSHKNLNTIQKEESDFVKLNNIG